MSGGARAEFLDVWQRNVTRPGSEKLLDWLDKKTDFFTAPASTRFHGACEGGLCMHSLNADLARLVSIGRITREAAERCATDKSDLQNYL